MEHQDLVHIFKNLGKDPSRLIFEDELTGIYNRRFLLNYLQHKVPWDSVERDPVSLLMMDVDYFKQINDVHGHLAGDEALIWLARTLREVAGDRGLPIRYAGDEFMILMPRVDKKAAHQLGQLLIQRVHDEPLHLEEPEVCLHLTLSIGLASSPDDARNGKGLIHKADTALYFAKTAGRDQLADVAEVSPEHVVEKTALHQLEEAKIAGRKKQLRELAGTLKLFSQRQSQFLVVEGAAGMGKSTFLETVKRSLSQSKVQQVSASGLSQELFRPYFLATNLLAGLLNQRPDEGAAILKELDAKELDALSYILPQLDSAKEQGQEEQDVPREHIFTTLAQFIPKVVDSQALIVFIDDLHLSDEATLLLLRQLVLQGDIPLFICASTGDSQQNKAEQQKVPWERFRAAFSEELNIRKIKLSPLSAIDILDHLRGIFPNVRLPDNFEEELAQITQGNPLFLGEIVRKLVVDGRITLVEQKWVLEPLEEGYLPRSLEEVVLGKISTLDDESRELLDQVSVMGDIIPLSMLAGSSEKNEAKVLEFIDQAVAQGLISSDFQMNDESIRFLSNRVQQIAYGSMQQEVREEMHERIGAYQENLYEQHLLPSAATLAYHFTRSANLEKARAYEELHVSHNNMIFRADEAVNYTGDKPTEMSPEDLPLDPDSLQYLPAMFRSFLLSVRNIKLYPAGSKAIVNANRLAKEAIEKFLEKNERLTIFLINRVLLINGQRIEDSEFKFSAESLIKILNRLELKGISFHKGFTEEELNVLIESFSRLKPEVIDQDFWERFVKEKNLVNIELTQVRYAMLAEGTSTTQLEPEQIKEGVPEAATISAPSVTAQLQLDAEDLRQLPEFIRYLLNAAKSIKLYPVHSKAIGSAIELLMQALHRILNKRAALTLARVGDSLLVNGGKVETTDFETLAQTFLGFLDSLALTSLTFSADVTADEMKTFIGALDELPAIGLNRNFWMRLAEERELKGILFDHHQYEAFLSTTTMTIETGLAGHGTAMFVQPVPVATAPNYENLIKEMPVRMSDLLLEGNEEEIEKDIKQLVEAFLAGSLQSKQEILKQFHSLMEGLNLGLQNQLAKLLAGPLLLAFSNEKDPVIVRELTALLHKLTTILIQFVEYPTGSRILLHLHQRHRELLDADDEQAALLGKILDKPLEAKTQQLLLEDFRSQVPLQQQSAAQLLGSLEWVGLPLLIDIIKAEGPLRPRQIAATLLGEQGPEAVKMLKRELLLQTTAEERVRILEVIDSVTRDLRTELTHALEDGNNHVRQAALQLASRLNDTHVQKLLLEYADTKEDGLAVAVIRYLGSLQQREATEKLISLLQSSNDEQQLIACCQALGQKADPETIDPLAQVLRPKGFLFLRKRYHEKVRVNAALALAQIDHPRIVEVLARHVDDPDVRVRQIAREIIEKSNGDTLRLVDKNPNST